MTTPDRTEEEYATIAAAQRRTARRHSRIRNLSMQVGVLVVVIGVWIVAAQNEWVTPLLLPKFSAVLDAFEAGLIQGQWWPHIGITMQETALGFVIGVALGLIVGALFAFVKPLHTAFYPYVIALMSFPKIAIAPLLIVAFGYDLTPKVIIATMLAFFPVMTSATAGLGEVNPDELNLMKAMGASKLDELRYLRIPNAMSYVFPSLDVALIGALLGAVAAELIGAQGGLGYVLSQGQAYGDVAGMYGVLILLAILGALMHTVITLVRRLLPMSVVPKSENK
ncbi:NitT/TauT family transport system permease protein [Antricoccus suffuscus]|uniref:NitT/TauT family transport system permease protein n=2 Tax=Antricoccus suffuscus TaxID=1629062 RepID=A0A2T0ZWY0_9ACTN|nr:NitT/TauT family transport system permease protein [Antricoccus suffuscus]